jgi:hypothetical protein
MRTLEIQRKLQQVTGGNPGENRDVFNPGTLLKQAYNTGIFNFASIGPPSKRFFKQPECCNRPAAATCKLQFYFQVPAAHAESYRLVELLVDDFCNQVRLYFRNYQPDTGAGPHFRHQFTVARINQLMIKDGQRIRAIECRSPMKIGNESTLLAIDDGPTRLAIGDGPTSLAIEV